MATWPSTVISQCALGAACPPCVVLPTCKNAHYGSAKVVVNVHGASGETLIVSRFM